MALVTDGQPRESVRGVRRAVAGSKATTEAARAADKAAKAVEQAVAGDKKAREGVRDARRVRDTVGETWESALAALKRLASVVAEEGAPDLYVKLLPPVSRAAPKAKTPEPEAPAETPAQAAA